MRHSVCGGALEIIHSLSRSFIFARRLRSSAYSRSAFMGALGVCSVVGYSLHSKSCTCILVERHRHSRDRSIDKLMVLELRISHRFIDLIPVSFHKLLNRCMS